MNISKIPHEKIEMLKTREIALLSCLKEHISGCGQFSRIKKSAQDEHCAVIFSHFTRVSSLIVSPISFWNSFRGWKLSRHFTVIDGSNLISKELHKHVEDLVPLDNVLALDSLKICPIFRKSIPIDWESGEDIPLSGEFEIDKTTLEKFANPYNSYLPPNATIFLEAISKDFWTWSVNIKLKNSNNDNIKISISCGWIERRRGLMRFIFG